MLPLMPRRILIAVLVMGWVSLSIFDLLEDLRVPSQQIAFNQTGQVHPLKSSRPSNLANNMVESALTAPSVHAPLLRPDHSQSAIHPLASLNRALSLHKLHRVFLI
jgi:hypothetical protein